jgi:hypothetical protein
MKVVELETESYLFSVADKTFRALPFYELSIDEWVIYENGLPTYFIDFNRRNDPIILRINAKISEGSEFGQAIEYLGRTIGRTWTIKSGIIGEEIQGTEQLEKVRLQMLTDLADI